MTYSIADTSHRKAARVAGFMYLFTMATAVFGDFYVRSSIIVPGNAAATANNIMASEQLFRIGIASNLIAFVGVVILIVALYILLKPVNKNLALLALAWRVTETAVFGVVMLSSFIVLLLLSGADYLTVFETDQLHALAWIFILAHVYGYFIAMIFFSLGSTVFSYLFLKSNYIPRILAAWGVFASVVLLIGTFVIILYPDYAAIILPGYFAPIIVFEVLLGLLLLFKGVNVQQADNRNEDTVAT